MRRGEASARCPRATSPRRAALRRRVSARLDKAADSAQFGLCGLCGLLPLLTLGLTSIPFRRVLDVLGELLDFLCLLHNTNREDVFVRFVQLVLEGIHEGGQLLGVLFHLFKL